MSGTHNNKPSNGPLTSDSNPLDNYSIIDNGYGYSDSYKGLLDGLLASDKAYSQIMGYFGETGSGTELKFNITDLGNNPTAFDTTINTIYLDDNLFDRNLEVTNMTGDSDGDGKLDGDLNSDGVLDAFDQNIYIQNLTTEAMLGVSGLTGTALETLKNDLATTDDTPVSSYFPLASNPLPEIEFQVDDTSTGGSHEDDTSGVHGGSHGSSESKSTTGLSNDPAVIAKELHDAYNVVGDAIDLDVEEEMQKLYDKHDDAIKAAQKKGDKEKEEAYNALTKDFQILAANIVQELSNAIANTEGDAKENLLDAAATWIKYGLHSAAENGENGNDMHGIHYLEHGNKYEQRAFQLAHVVNPGNDTKIGDIFRKKGDTTDALHKLDGDALLKLMENGTLADLFTSDTKYVNGEAVADPDGTKISTGWGASGDARMSAQSEWGMGARQNIWSTHAAFDEINKQ